MEHRPKQKGETVKFVEDYIENLADLESDSEFLSTKPKDSYERKKQLGESVIKIKNFFFGEDTVRVKRQVTPWAKMFVKACYMKCTKNS